MRQLFFNEESIHEISRRYLDAPYIHTYIHTYTHKHTHTYTHSHIQAKSNMSPLFQSLGHNNRSIVHEGKSTGTTYLCCRPLRYSVFGYRPNITASDRAVRLSILDTRVVERGHSEIWRYILLFFSQNLLFGYFSFLRKV